MHSFIYDKTDKGREEIATRKYQVPAKMRTLLVLIDGRHTLEWLLKNVAGLGLNEANIDQLLQQGYITLVSGAPAVSEAALADASAGVAPDRAKPPASARARMLARQAAARQALVANGAEADEPESESESESDAAPEEPAPAPARKGFFDYFNLASESTNF